MSDQAKLPDNTPINAIETIGLRKVYAPRGAMPAKIALDGIDGLGEARKKRLIQAFGGVNAVKRATIEDLTALSWLPEAVARAIHEKFNPGT